MSIRERIMEIPLFKFVDASLIVTTSEVVRQKAADLAEDRERELQNELDDVLSDYAELKKDFAELSESERELLAQRDELLAFVKRYFHEVPLGHQPHMMAHQVEALLARIAKAEGGGA